MSITYRVRTGEASWVKLAYLYLGSVSNFRELYDLNQQALQREPFEDELIYLPTEVSNTANLPTEEDIFDLDAIAATQDIGWII